MSAATPITVLLADDVRAYRALIRVVLEHDGRFEVVGEADDGAEAVRMSETLRPDTVLLDIAMPVMDGLQAIPAILAASPGTAVVVLSGFARAQLEREAVARGAVAYLEKSEAPGRIVSTLAEVVAEAAAATG